MTSSLLRWLCASAICAQLLSCSSSASAPKRATAGKPDKTQPAGPQRSAYERHWGSACKEGGTVGRCPEPFDRPGVFFDAGEGKDLSPPTLCVGGEQDPDPAAQTALGAELEPLQACFRGAQPGAWVDVDLLGARAARGSAEISTSTLACVAKLVERALPRSATRSAKQAVVINGSAARAGKATLSNDSVHAMIVAHADEVGACYDGALKVWPGLRGRLVPSVVIWFDGSVALVRTQESSFDNPALECCINTAVSSWRFDPPANASIAIVNLPLVLGQQP